MSRTRICGIRRRNFWILCAVSFVLAAVTLGTSVAAGLDWGIRSLNDNSNGTSPRIVPSYGAINGTGLASMAAGGTNHVFYQALDGTLRDLTIDYQATYLPPGEAPVVVASDGRNSTPMAALAWSVTGNLSSTSATGNDDDPDLYFFFYASSNNTLSISLGDYTDYGTTIEWKAASTNLSIPIHPSSRSLAVTTIAGSNSNSTFPQAFALLESEANTVRALKGTFGPTCDGSLCPGSIFSSDYASMAGTDYMWHWNDITSDLDAVTGRTGAISSPFATFDLDTLQDASTNSTATDEATAHSVAAAFYAPHLSETSSGEPSLFTVYFFDGKFETSNATLTWLESSGHNLSIAGNTSKNSWGLLDGHGFSLVGLPSDTNKPQLLGMYNPGVGQDPYIFSSDASSHLPPPTDDDAEVFKFQGLTTLLPNQQTTSLLVYHQLDESYFAEQLYDITRNSYTPTIIPLDNTRQQQR